MVALLSSRRGINLVRYLARERTCSCVSEIATFGFKEVDFRRRSTSVLPRTLLDRIAADMPDEAPAIITFPEQPSLAKVKGNATRIFVASEGVDELLLDPRA